MNAKEKTRELQSIAYKDCATMLRGCRLEAGMTQVQVARAMKTKQSVISRWESGEVNLALKTMTSFVDACGYHLDVVNVPAAIRFVARKGLRSTGV